MKYRKRPVVIDAVKWDGKQWSEVPVWLADAAKKGVGEDGRIVRIGQNQGIYTLEGVMEARPGDMLIRGVNGEIYPCKPDIFAKTYEEVKTESTPSSEGKQISYGTD